MPDDVLTFLSEGRLHGKGGREGQRSYESVFMDTAAATPYEAPPPSLPIRVFILNDHKMVRQGLSDLLEHEGFEVVGDSGSAAESVRLIHVLEPDIAVLDDRLPDGTGIEVCREIRSTAPGVRCLILTSLDEQHAVRAAVLAGASGYVIKRIGDSEALVKCIRSTAAGVPAIWPGVRERVAESLYATASAPWLRGMTQTERKVLAHMARGYTNRQIAQDMMLPDATVASYVSAVLQKLGFRRRGQLIPGAWDLLH
ncbi:response regulator [Pseudarthrobacter defluvii]|uniref:response regulator n=1 Tax=Pseudarthrobacter defluvii TaxID=410837 RepID=UPI0027D84EC4|nr:response regulator transcription factor [Pseudarthrobacter defluvii]